MVTHLLFSNAFDPRCEKTYVLTCAFSEDTNQLVNPRSLIRALVVRIKKVCILGCPKCAKCRVWSDCANVQSLIRLREMRRLIWIFAGRIYLKVRFLPLGLVCTMYHYQHIALYPCISIITLHMFWLLYHFPVITFRMLNLNICKRYSKPFSSSIQTWREFISSKTSMARTCLGPWKFIRDMGSSSHWGLIMAKVLLFYCHQTPLRLF